MICTSFPSWSFTLRRHDDEQPPADAQGDATPPAEDVDDEPLGDAGAKALEAFKSRAREAERKAREEAKKAAELAARVKEFEDAQKTEAERLAARAEEAERKAAEAEAKALRAEIGLTKRLPAELLSRLQGNTREELEADADQLLALLSQAAPSSKPAGPPADGSGGPKGGGTPGDFREATRDEQVKAARSLGIRLRTTA